MGRVWHHFAVVFLCQVAAERAPKHSVLPIQRGHACDRGDYSPLTHGIHRASPPGLSSGVQEHIPHPQPSRQVLSGNPTSPGIASAEGSCTMGSRTGIPAVWAGTGLLWCGSTSTPLPRRLLRFVLSWHHFKASPRREPKAPHRGSKALPSRSPRRFLPARRLSGWKCKDSR